MPPPKSKPLSQPLQVLMVEDSEDDAALLLRELRRGGYEPRAERVESAEAMAAALARERWDLVVADNTLPQFCAPAALALLREREEDLPFIIVSGTLGEEAAVTMMQAGADDYLLKGQLARLVPAVERALRQAHERQARRQAERALQGSELRFRSLIENASGIIAIIDSAGTLLYESAQVERILGYPPAERIGRKLAEYAHPDDASILAALLEQVIRQPRVLVPVEFRTRHRDGAWRVVGAMARSLLDDPVVQGIILNEQDITERRQLEEQLRQSQKMDAIGRLAGGVAHDFNNMLGAITGYGELLLARDGADEFLRSCLQEIMKAADRAATLTRQLLVFSRREVASPQVLDLGEVASGMHKMLHRLIGEDIELVTRADPAAGCVKADPGQIEQVLLNLAVNARDAMPHGGKLTIETSASDQWPVASGQETAQTQSDLTASHWPLTSEPCVLLSVSDTGFGMDAATQAHIFEPFFTTKEPGKGTGLGLATVYGIVQQSGGQIRVESQPGCGTTFRIYLPRATETAPAAPPAATAGAPLAGTETILLVEDEPILRRLLIEVLRMSGYTVLEAEQGDEALQICRRSEPMIDLLVTDVVLPGIGGRELAEQAVALQPAMKVLFMSGYTEDALVRRGVKEAEIAFLQKPFKPAALAQKVREVLGAR